MWSSQEYLVTCRKVHGVSLQNRYMSRMDVKGARGKLTKIKTLSLVYHNLLILCTVIIV